VTKMHYDLWDVETGNYFGRFEREEDALAVVRTLVSHYGNGYADRLSLGAEDDDGSWTEPIEGAALLARTKDASPSVTIRHLSDPPRNGATERAADTEPETAKRPKSA
jgi:hypothetical protein